MRLVFTQTTNIKKSILKLISLVIIFIFVVPGISMVECGKDTDEYQGLRKKMVAKQIKDRGVVDQKVLEAMGKIPRHMFVPESLRSQAYQDYPLAIGEGQTISQPYIVENPTIAFTLVLSGILLFSGAGGYLSQKMNQFHLHLSLICIACFFIGLYIGFEHLIEKLLGLPDVIRYVMAFLILVPVGLLMGIPFSIGIRLLLNTPLDRAYAWAANGCASVLTSIAAAQVAISQGISTIIILAAGAYFLSLLGCKMKKS